MIFGACVKMERGVRWIKNGCAPLYDIEWRWFRWYVVEYHMLVPPFFIRRSVAGPFWRRKTAVPYLKVLQ